MKPWTLPLTALVAALIGSGKLARALKANPQETEFRRAQTEVDGGNP